MKRREFGGQIFWKQHILGPAQQWANPARSSKKKLYLTSPPLRSKVARLRHSAAGDAQSSRLEQPGGASQASSREEGAKVGVEKAVTKAARLQSTKTQV